MTTLHERAALLRRLHAREDGRPLVLPNAWDAVSARLVEEAGARAIATTSSGVSWSLGRADGHGLARDEMLAAVRRIAAAVRVPVTADVEGGYGAETPEDVAETVRGVLDAGAVGVNLEDTRRAGGPALLDPAAHAGRLAAARAAADSSGIPLFVNARVDVYLRQAGAPETRFDETVRRAHAYVAAGADGIFVPGVADADTIGRLAAAIDAPLNVLAGPDSPDVATLAALGVARISLGGGLAEAAMALVRRAANEVLREGTYHALGGALSYAELNGLFG
ncbi:MAG: isocitrate lyase/phosphoenolpyruvate mutase family protein [Gemmatirosa sp.]|nr:isocitrate lyase/phosphoenolpyruvate mutase family protein [Gemmatirosa sp.]